MTDVNPTIEAVDVDRLLEIAGPSIEYRTRREILGASSRSERMADLQSKIVEDRSVQRILSIAREDGWIGDTFHGTEGIEGGIRLLCEKGLAREHPVLAKALDALAAGDDRLHLGIGKVGRVLDDAGLGGSEMIRAAVHAYAGDEDRPHVARQVEGALEGFRSVLSVRSVDEISEEYKGKLVFREGAQWPSIYHLRLLSGTHGWRTTGSVRAVASAVERLVDLSPIPEIYLRLGSQLMAPASFAMNDFTSGLDEVDGYGQMLWFHRMELLGRVGVLSLVPSVRQLVDRLAGMLEDGLFGRKLNHPSFQKWGVYAGLALERDWRAPSRRIADLTFRALLILRCAAS